VAFNTGGTGESGQNYGYFITSGDNGVTWSSPVLIIDGDDEADIGVYDNSLWVDPKGRLWTFWCQSYGWYDADNCPMWEMHTDNPGDPDPSWSEPRIVGQGLASIKHTVLNNGDWVMCAFGRDGHQDGIPQIYVYVTTDEGVTWIYRGTVPYPTTDYIGESMIVQLSNSKLRMIARTNEGLVTSISSDNGSTWTPAERIYGITDEISRFHYGKLPSGNLLMVYNVRDNGGTAVWGNRYNMIVAVSTDEGETWKTLLLDERGNVSYPDADYDDRGNIYIVYDRERTGALEILLAVVTEDDIRADRVTPPSYLKRVINDNRRNRKIQRLFN
jgi:hypothetical protein